VETQQAKAPASNSSGVQKTKESLLERRNSTGFLMNANDLKSLAKNSAILATTHDRWQGVFL